MNIAGWENMYRSGERGKDGEPTILLQEVASQLIPGSAIDLACGTGRHALYLAEKGWSVTAVDASETAIKVLRQRSFQRGLQIQTQVADLTSVEFAMPTSKFELVVVAYYLQRDLFERLKTAVQLGGILVAIVHTSEAGEQSSATRAAAGELRRYFSDWEILHDYEGPSRDPEHRRPVAEIAARRNS